MEVFGIRERAVGERMTVYPSTRTVRCFNKATSIRWWKTCVS
jgi:hypothetical protein